MTPQRIGLSATQRPLATIAEFLGGGIIVDDLSASAGGDRQTLRPPTPRPRDRRAGRRHDRPTGPAPDPLDPEIQRVPSIWPAIYPEILELIESPPLHHRVRQLPSAGGAHLR